MTALAATTPPPTRRQEEWRYSDIAAVARAWPVMDEVIEVTDGGSERRVILQLGQPGGEQIRHLTIQLGVEARMSLHLVVGGSDYGRIAVDVEMQAGAAFELGGVIIAKGSQTLEIVTTVRHLGPGATSRQIVRCVAGDTATATYLGKVAVARAGQQTDAAQSFKALLLDRGATANAKPELEIFADDVKCAHGATVGELDRNALFYLESRGIPPVEARALLTRAFLSDALAGIADDAARDVAEARVTGLLA
ncbi:SufD family Fe-S cluster assembly protein [Sandarakinorhabdus sp. DWP1-3-1]|uniref:SufD family Fe-S cluster assembly protein n=1 Tax=Sandarakinorhabdus sp. DWP1-3-1 TaxID=2804627 RepID=UPI003CF2973A